MNNEEKFETVECTSLISARFDRVAEAESMTKELFKLWHAHTEEKHESPGLDMFLSLDALKKLQPGSPGLLMQHLALLYFYYPEKFYEPDYGTNEYTEILSDVVTRGCREGWEGCSDDLKITCYIFVCGSVSANTECMIENLAKVINQLFSQRIVYGKIHEFNQTAIARAFVKAMLYALRMRIVDVLPANILMDALLRSGIDKSHTCIDNTLRNAILNALLVDPFYDEQYRNPATMEERARLRGRAACNVGFEPALAKKNDQVLNQHGRLETIKSTLPDYDYGLPRWKISFEGVSYTATIQEGGHDYDADGLNKIYYPFHSRTDIVNVLILKSAFWNKRKEESCNTENQEDYNGIIMKNLREGILDDVDLRSETHPVWTVMKTNNKALQQMFLSFYQEKIQENEDLRNRIQMKNAPAWPLIFSCAEGRADAPESSSKCVLS